MKTNVPLSLKPLLVVVCSFFIVAACSEDAAAQSIKIVDFAGVNISGQAFQIPTGHAFKLQAIPTPNDPGTYNWTISGAYEITAGSITSNTVTVRWTSPGTYTAQIVFVASGDPPGNPISTSTTIIPSSTFTEIPPQECSVEPQKISPAAQTPAYIDFTNRTGQTVKLYWIDYAGNRTLISTFTPGAGARVSMWLGFPWVVTDANEGCMGIYEPVAQPGKVTIINVESVQFEIFVPNNEALNLNPNAGGGRRIYPDKRLPGESAGDALNRKRVKVKAKLSFFVADTKIYFKSFDIDDPSATALPVDDDTGAKINDPDNRGNVNGSTAGELASAQCVIVTGVLECPTDGTGLAIAEFTVTMNPGDNFALAASTNKAYLLGVTQAGTDLKNPYNVTLPLPPGPTTPSSLGWGARSEMLTVWRKLHIEVDSMGNVGTANNATGTINGAVTIPKRTGQNQVGAPTVVNVTPGSTFALQRFERGRLVSGANSLLVATNTATSVTLHNTTTKNINLANNAAFTIYDDDDYNANDSTIAAGNINAATYLVDGDNNEALVELADVFKHLGAEDGNNGDGTPINVYGNAYVMPEYNWAAGAGYDQSNITFDANVFSDQTATDELFTALNANRGSTNDESAEFWVAYFLTGYQGREDEDGDGCRINPVNSQCATDGSGNALPEGVVPGISKRALTSTGGCDCLSSGVCPAAVPPNNAPISCTSVPTGSYGSAIFEEGQQDVFRTWLLLTGAVTNQLPTTAPHELGHQFGLAGDQLQTTFGFMDYSALPASNALALHPQHINLIRHRINSPGQ